MGEPVDRSVNATINEVFPVRGDAVKAATGGRGLTVKRFVPIPDCPALFDTRTFHCPDAAPARLIVPVTCEEETMLTLVAVISNCPLFINFTDVTLSRLDPARLVILTRIPVVADDGVMPETVGDGGAVVAVVAVVVVVVVVVVFVIVNTFPSVAVCPSGFVTVTFHVPAIAPEGIENRQVMFDADWAVTLVPKMVEGDVTLVSLTLAPGRKVVPDILVIVTVVPACPAFGVMLLTVGAGYEVVVVVTVTVGTIVAAVSVTTGTSFNETTCATFAG